MGHQEEKYRNDSKTDNAKENFTDFPNILKRVLCPIKLCELEGTSSQKAETNLCICYE